MAEPENKQPESKKGYGKRPLWQWILLYVIIGGIVYAAAYFFYFHKTGYNTDDNTSQSAPY